MHSRYDCIIYCRKKKLTRNEIVEALGRERRVEQICAAITRLPQGHPDLSDLGQHIYLILLEYDEGKLQDLWEHGEINFLIYRLAMNNYWSKKSRFHYIFRVFRSRSVSLNGVDIKDDE